MTDRQEAWIGVLLTLTSLALAIVYGVTAPWYMGSAWAANTVVQGFFTYKLFRGRV